MVDILIGTCSWTDPTLLATGFYPREASNAEKRLQYYAHNFPIVEVDSTYYSMLAERTARLWVERTPEDFKFNVKAFSLFTQHPTKLQALPRDLRAIMPPLEKANIYYRDVPEDARSLLWRRFGEALLPLDSAGKLGVVLLQFPEWFFPSKAAEEHLLQCKENLAQYRLAIEFRNGTWLSENRRQRTLDLLKEHDFTYVCVDEPQGFRSSVPPIAEATSDIGAVRFHGRNKNNWEKKGITVAERFKYLYSSDELDEWLPKLAELASKVKQLHVLFNNCYADYGVRNARDIDRLIRTRTSLFPDYMKSRRKGMGIGNSGVASPGVMA
jgi:uncharacterized protein YecE (DUF72 family)